MYTHMTIYTNCVLHSSKQSITLRPSSRPRAEATPLNPRGFPPGTCFSWDLCLGQLRSIYRMCALFYEG